MAVSGVAVATIGAGVLFTYAGLRGINPLAALREVASGTPGAVARRDSASGSYTGQTPVPSGGVNGAQGAALVNAARRNVGDIYSQIRRWDPGYSDCSSFVGKAFRAIGIKPPGLSLCVNYLTWPAARQIPRSQLAVGDLCVNQAHMVIATGVDTAIGQETTGVNVQTGTPESLMWGTGAWVCLRWTGTQQPRGSS